MSGNENEIAIQMPVILRVYERGLDLYPYQFLDNLIENILEKDELFMDKWKRQVCPPTRIHQCMRILKCNFYLKKKRKKKVGDLGEDLKALR